MADFSVRGFGRGGQFGVLLALPLTTALAWYCYDYLTPSIPEFGPNPDPNWAPYQHGLTMQRYWATLVVQVPITLFGVLYCDAAIRHVSKKPLISIALGLAALIGAAVGFSVAMQQIRLS